MKGIAHNPLTEDISQVDKFVLRHMRDFICDTPDGTPKEIKDLLRQQLREVASHKKAEHLANEIREDFYRLLKNHPELLNPKKTAKQVNNVEVIYTSDNNLSPNFISADLSDGATLIENRYGYFDVYCIKPQILANQTPEQIRFKLIKTGRATRFLKPNEKIIVAPSKGTIGTLIEQELDGDKIVLTYQLIIMPQLEKIKDEDSGKAPILTPQELADLEL